jgi:mono/diheme cytochrome c family protein
MSAMPRKTGFDLTPSLGWLAALVVAWALCPASVSAQAAKALYTAAQAEQGRQVYEASCSRCHDPDLSGKGDAPALTGPYFASSWGGRKVSELIGLVSFEMPYDEAGTLDEASYLRVVAYLLSKNGLPAGNTALVSGAAGVIAVAKD